MKFFALIPAALIAATPALAQPVDPGFSVGRLSRGPVFAVRACAEETGGDYTAVCYNQTTSGELFPFSRGVGIEINREHTVLVRCDVPHAASTVRGQVAKEYCPQVRAGSLPPAPFLL